MNIGRWVEITIRWRILSYTVIGCCALASQLCTQEYTSKNCHFVVYKCTAQYAHTCSRPVHHACRGPVLYPELPAHGLSCCVARHPPLCSIIGQAATPRWPTFHLQCLRPEKAPRDVRHAKSHCLERLCRIVALRDRKLEDPQSAFIPRAALE